MYRVHLAISRFLTHNVRGDCKREGMVLGHPKIAYRKHYEIVCLTVVLHLYLQVHVIQVITPKVLISLLHLNLTRCE